MQEPVEDDLVARSALVDKVVFYHAKQAVSAHGVAEFFQRLAAGRRTRMLAKLNAAPRRAVEYTIGLAKTHRQHGAVTRANEDGQGHSTNMSLSHSVLLIDSLSVRPEHR